MGRLNKLDVYYHDFRVGTMALYQNRLATFEYDSNWITEGFSISPFSLPLKKGYLCQGLIHLKGFLEYLQTVFLMVREDC